MPPCFVYILENTVGRTYVGVSDAPRKRLKTHNSAAPSLARHYTNRNRPWKIVAVIDGFQTKRLALRAEHAIKHKPTKASRRGSRIAIRVATASLTCSRLLKSDKLYDSSNAMRTVVLNETVCTAVLNMTKGRLHDSMMVWYCDPPGYTDNKKQINK